MTEQTIKEPKREVKRRRDFDLNLLTILIVLGLFVIYVYIFVIPERDDLQQENTQLKEQKLIDYGFSKDGTIWIHDFNEWTAYNYVNGIWYKNGKEWGRHIIHIEKNVTLRGFTTQVEYTCNFTMVNGENYTLSDLKDNCKEMGR